MTDGNLFCSFPLYTDTFAAAAGRLLSKITKSVKYYTIILDTAVDE